MASLTLTIDDSIVPRIQAAYGVASAGQLKNAVIAEIKKKVVAFELQAIEATENTKIQTALANKDTAVAGQVQTSNTEIVIS